MVIRSSRTDPGETMVSKTTGRPSHATHRMPQRREQIFKLRDEIGLSERQIARVLNVSKTTVHYWLTREKVA